MSLREPLYLFRTSMETILIYFDSTTFILKFHICHMSVTFRRASFLSKYPWLVIAWVSCAITSCWDWFCHLAFLFLDFLKWGFVILWNNTKKGFAMTEKDFFILWEMIFWRRISLSSSFSFLLISWNRFSYSHGLGGGYLWWHKIGNQMMADHRTSGRNQHLVIRV